MALAGIGAGVGAGILGKFGAAANAWGAAAQAAAGNAITQGIGIATGLQSRFDFAGVAAAGVGGGIGHEVGARIGGSNMANFAASVSAAGIANAATRSAIKGNSFGDNLIAALPDLMAQIAVRAIGTAFDGVSAPPTEGKVQTTGDAAEIFVNEQAIQLAFGYDPGQLARQAVIDRIFTRAAQSLPGMNGLSLAETDWASMNAASVTLDAYRSYTGGGDVVAGASFIAHAKSQFGVGSGELADYAGALGRDVLFKGVTDPGALREIGMTYGRQIVAEGFGLVGGARDPGGLRIAETILRSYAQNWNMAWVSRLRWVK